MKKLTIPMSEDVYEGLYAKIGTEKINRFLDDLACPHVVAQEIHDVVGIRLCPGMWAAGCCGPKFMVNGLICVSSEIST